MNRAYRTSLLIAALLTAPAALIAAPGAAEHPTGHAALPAFELFKALEGEWEGTRPNGGLVQVRYEVVADGTAVVEYFDMKGEAGHDTMVTVYHVDGEDLVLTHYCVAGNQPRMIARSPSGKKVRFEFLDATGLESPDDGHMYRAVFQFQGEDRMSTAWTFRQGGEDQFTEAIEIKRVSDSASR